MKNLLIGIIILFLFSSCKKTEGENENVQPANTTKLTVTIRRVTYNPYLDTTVAGAVITLYKSLDDRTNKANAVNSRTTNSSGIAAFTSLNESTYYLDIYHNSHGTLTRTVSTPKDTHSYETLTYN